MDSFGRENLRNIKEIFEEKTGVALEGRHRRHPLRTAIVLAAVMVCCLTVTGFSVSLFSSLNEDELAISATYEGDGIVLVQIENQSDKDLNFQKKLKLMLWSTGEEIQPVSNSVKFSGTGIGAHSSGIMTIDLSKAYDMAMLEQPLTDDHYYFILTNNNFAFGQDWMCSVEFANPIITSREEPEPVMPIEADPPLVAEIMEELRPYFESYTTNRTEGRRLSDQYLSLCRQVLSQVDGRIVSSVSPMELTVIDSSAEVVFDPFVPSDMQLQLTGLHRRTTDGYDKIIGSTQDESALVLSAYLPQSQGDVDGGVDVPLLYIFTYEKNAVQSPRDYVFIRGRLLTFEQMEPYKIYEDEQYVCYEASSLFYSDLQKYVESMVSQRSDVYFDEQIWERVQNIYSYYKENLGSLLGYRDGQKAHGPANETQESGQEEPMPVNNGQGSGQVGETVPPNGSQVTGREEKPVPSKPQGGFQTETCLDDPKNPVSEQNYRVGEPNWND